MGVAQIGDFTHLRIGKCCHFRIGRRPQMTYWGGIAPLVQETDIVGDAPHMGTEHVEPRQVPDGNEGKYAPAGPPMASEERQTPV